MGDIGVFEVLLLAVVSLLVLGPEQMVRTGREAGRWVRQLRSLANNMRIVLTDELEQSEQARGGSGTLPGTGGARSFDEVVAARGDKEKSEPEIAPESREQVIKVAARGNKEKSESEK